MSVVSHDADGALAWKQPDQMDHGLGADVTHLRVQLRNLSEDVRTIEGRQVALDRRLAEFGSLVQGIQEEQYTQTCTIERSQKTLAVGAQRALHAAVAVQQNVEQEAEWQKCLDKMSPGSLAEFERRWDAKLDEHKRWLMELSADVAAIGLEASQNGVAPLTLARLSSPGNNGDSGPASNMLGARLMALEKSQKTVALSSRRALHTALVVHQQQKVQEHEDEWHKCMESVARPVAELEQQCAQRFSEQDERLDKILRMVDTLADKVLLQALPDVCTSDGSIDVTLLARHVREQSNQTARRFEEIESTLQTRQPGTDIMSSGFDVGGSRGNMSTAFENLEAQVDRSLADVAARMDALQEGKDQQRLMLRQMSNQLPEVAHKLDQLWTQCQYYFPRVKEHDVHFSFFRTSFEAHKQQMLDFTDNVERRRSPSRDASRGYQGEQNPRARMLAEVMARLHSDTEGPGSTDVNTQRYDHETSLPGGVSPGSAHVEKE